MAVALLCLVELALLCGAAFALARRGGGAGAAECGALALAAVLAGLSGLYQLAFLLRTPELAIPVEALLSLAAIGVIWRERSGLLGLARGARDSAASAPLPAAALALALAFLALQALLLPPYGNDPLSYHLPRVLLFQQERTLFPAEFSKYDLVVKTLGADLLSHLFLRHYSDRGVVWLPLMAYGAALAGGFALARRHARSETAWLAALAVAGMPQLVHQAAVFKSNIFAAMAAVLCLLLGQRLRERPRAGDAALLLVMLAFGLSARPNFLAFALPFAICFGVLLARQAEPGAWRGWIAGPLPLLLALPAALLLSQLWLLARNQLAFGTPGGPAGFVDFHRNSDGLLGGAANLIRYALQSVHLLAPVDQAFAALGSAPLSDALERLYQRFAEPLFGSAGHSASFPRFGLSASPREETSWFGPFGCFLALPALLAAALWGRSALRAGSLALLAYGAIFSFSVAWFPWNGRMLALVFAAALPSAAWALERLAPSRGSRRALTALGVAVLAYSCWHSQPAGAWRTTDFGRDRLAWLARELGPGAARLVRRGFEPGSRVLLLVDQTTPTAPILLSAPQTRFTLLWPWLQARMEPGFALEDYLARRDPRFDLVLCLAPSEPLCQRGSEARSTPR